MKSRGRVIAFRHQPRNHIYTDLRRIDRWLDKVSVRERVSEDAR